MERNIVGRKAGNEIRSRTQVQPAQLKGTQSKSTQKELRLLALIHGNHNASRIELAKMTGASAGSMTSMVQQLIRKGLVIESG